jgi:short subunit dehydrogenase-like uncharacterized protein
MAASRKTNNGRRAEARRWTVVVYGASGFVGRQCAAYLARHAPGVKLALAGRDAAKLREVAAAAGLSEDDIVVADAHDAAALDALTARTRVLLSCAGPYSVYGSEVVAACVRQRTHYCDITGETTWVRGLIERHHEQAARDGTRIVPFCGFDSVPADIGTWLLTREALARFDEPCVNVKAAYVMKGGFNGGTLATLLHVAETDRKRSFFDPFLLNPKGSVPSDVAAHADPFAPHHDADFRAWVGPFVMGAINTRVVRRSAALALLSGDRGYGADFHYQEYMRFGRGPAAAVAAATFSAGLLSGAGMARLKPWRRLAQRFMPKPGEGPSVASMDSGFFRCDLVGYTSAGHALRARVADQGDPGNRATTKFVCEAALTLAGLDSQAPAGVLTPASALDGALVERLRQAGMTLEIRDE